MCRKYRDSFFNIQLFVSWQKILQCTGTQVYRCRPKKYIYINHRHHRNRNHNNNHCNINSNKDIINKHHVLTAWGVGWQTKLLWSSACGLCINSLTFASFDFKLSVPVCLASFTLSFVYSTAGEHCRFLRSLETEL